MLVSSGRPVAFENFACGTGHEDVVGRFVPNQFQVSAQQVIAQVEKAGYGARLLEDTTPDMLDKETMERVAMLRARLTVSLIAGLPVVALSMVPVLQFDGWKWWALMLSLPVVGESARAMV